jgi:GT2 family glycosyltransferase
MPGRVPVIIPFYKAPDKLERCLAHLRRQTYPNVEPFVRDNSEDNIFFTAAVNEGLRRFMFDPEVRYIAILNQDAYLDPRAIELLVGFLEQQPDAGIACPLQHDEMGRVTWGGSLQSFPFGVHRCDPIESYQHPTETPWANGAAFVIRPEVVREVGLLDANMKFICSDADFSLSARARGWKIYLVPEARCLHTISASQRGTDAEIGAIKLRDALYFARKWVSGDLYRTLAYEGAQLMRLEVGVEIKKLERTLSEVERTLQNRPPPPRRPSERTL